MTIIDELESARSQIEGKFSRAGTVLESAIALIGQQLQFLSHLNVLLNDQETGASTQELTTISSGLRALPTLLDVRGTQLRDLEHKGVALLSNIEEMRSFLKYLLVFALNVKITAADNALDAQQFDIFAQEMRTRIENGEAEINDFEARLNDLLEQVRAALRLEAELKKEATAMVPAVPDRLSSNAAAIREHQKQISGMTTNAALVAQKIQLKVIDALSALQIGDISRQRIEHVQNGLSLLDEADQRLNESGHSQEARDRLRQYLYRLLAAQLSDTAAAFERDSRSMLSNMSRMATDAQDLLRLEQMHGASTGSQSNLRSLEQSVADAILLVTDVEQAVLSADHVRKATALAVDELVGRVDAIKSVKEDVQFMALNTTVSCSRMGDAGKPLQVIAVELRLYAKKLESVAETTLQILRSLGDDVANLGDGCMESHSQQKLEAAATRLRNAADLAETSLTKIMGHGSEVVDSLSKAESELNFDTELGNVLFGTADELRALAGKNVIHVDDISEPLQTVLDAILHSYTMARERDVHAQFSLSASDLSVRAA